MGVCVRLTVCLVADNLDIGTWDVKERGKLKPLEIVDFSFKQGYYNQKGEIETLGNWGFLSKTRLL